jgi:hypothetical protein
VTVVKSTGVPDAVVIVEEPKFIVRVSVPDPKKLALAFVSLQVILKLFVLKVPCVTATKAFVSVFELPKTVNASPSPKVIPEPVTTTLENVFPAVVSVPLPVNVNAIDAPLNVMPATSVTLPATVIAALCVSVPVNPVQLIDNAPVLPAEMVTVEAPDAASKKTASAVVGTAAPPPPPDVVDHLVPAVPSHAAVPPTQYLSAI